MPRIYNPIAWIMIGFIKLYQHSLSAFFGRSCRFLPSCSEYSINAIAYHGAWAGFWLGLSRFWRCRPGCDYGFDPVPPTLAKNAKWYCPWRYGCWKKHDL